MRIVTFAVSFCFLLQVIFLTDKAAGQQDPRSRDFQEQFILSRKTSADLERKYTWNTRTDVTREGKVMDILIEKDQVGSDGKVISEIINDQQASLPSSFIAHKIAEEERDKTVDFMKELRIYLEQYSLRDPNDLITFFTKARSGITDKEEQTMLEGQDVICKGDRMFWWIDPQTIALSKISISTVFKGEQVEFTATYKNLPTGLNYIAFAEVILPTKSITVQLHSYDYTKMN
jgi:hypothetical protein